MRHRSDRVAARRVAIVGVVLLTAALSAPVAIAGEVTVRIGSSLDPASLRVAPGTTVTWINQDEERHRVRSTSGPSEFDSGNLEPGQRYTVTFTATGTWSYEDHRNPEQAQYHGTITVAAGASATGGGDEPAGPPPEAADVAIAHRAFAPGDVTVAVGGTVRWANDDDRDHTVSATDGSFGSSVLGTGDGFDHTFDAAGVYRYLCAIHPEMTGSVTVVAASAPASPAPTASPTPAPTPTPSIDTGVAVVDPGAASSPGTSAPGSASAPDTGSALQAATPQPDAIAATQPTGGGELLRQLAVVSIMLGALIVFAGIVRSVAHPRG